MEGTRVCVATRLDAAPILAGEEERGMANFLEYNPEQAYLLPPTVREVLGEGHLCFFVHGAVEKLNLQEFEAGYSDEGHPAYHPALLLKVWLYAYALGMTSSRRLEQRIREDLAFRYLAGGAQPDFWARAEKSSRGVCPGHDGVEPDAHVAAQSPLKIPRAEEIQTAPGYNFTGMQMDHGNHQKLAKATKLPHRLVHPRGDGKYAEHIDNTGDGGAT